MRTILLSALLSLTASVAPALAEPIQWRTEPDMAGLNYEGRTPPGGGDLMVGGWRDDGGSSIDDKLSGVGFYSTPDRIGISTKALTGRTPHGIPSWRIQNFMSVPAARNTAWINIDCGIGKDFATRRDRTKMVAAILAEDAMPAGAELSNATSAAVQIDLTTGAMTPLPADGSVWCTQELVE